VGTQSGSGRDWDVARPLQVTGDPADNKFLECADAARGLLSDRQPAAFAEILEETKVITSREFISIEAPHFVP
jgi:uncharacterized protein